MSDAIQQVSPAPQPPRPAVEQAPPPEIPAEDPPAVTDDQVATRLDVTA